MPIPPTRLAYFAPIILAAATGLSSLALSTPVAQAADSPFIDQIPSGVTVAFPPNFSPLLNPHPTATPTFVPGFAPAPQFAVPHSSNTNVAATIEIGNANHVLQVQDGIGDESAVGIIGGNDNNVGVVQTGNNLQSNLLLIGTKGMNISVLQPNGSAPVNMAVIHVPAGTVIIPHL
jgi:hypothetical protein